MYDSRHRTPLGLIRHGGDEFRQRDWALGSAQSGQHLFSSGSVADRFQAAIERVARSSSGSVQTKGIPLKLALASQLTLQRCKLLLKRLNFPLGASDRTIEFIYQRHPDLRNGITHM
jgi:hypothetical protein